jgi:hypothetical protein
MKRNSTWFLCAAAAWLTFAPLMSAQTASSGQPPPESVRPGTLNYIEGQAELDGQPLDRQSVGHATLLPGQVLATSPTGYAEVLLTPGAFLRVGPDTEFRMPSVGLADTRIELTRGNALIEADQLLDGTHLEITIGRTSVDLLKKGLYGFSTNPASVKTFKGVADVIGLDKSRKLGGHKEVLLTNNDQMKQTSFNDEKAKKDPLYVWSEARSRDEAAQNQLVAQNSDGYVPVGSGWFWDPYVNYYGFWGPDAFYSPFGFGFYGGFYPGFYGGYWGGYRRGYLGGWRGRPGGYGGYHGFHGNGAAGGFHGGGFHGGGGGFHGGGGGFHGGGGGHR